MDLVHNPDILSVGVAVAASVLLGFSVFFSNKKSVTSKAFLIFTLISAVWGLANNFIYHAPSVELSFFFLRLTLALAIWQAFALFNLFYVFPSEDKQFNAWHFEVLTPAVATVSTLALTPFVFSGVTASAGSVVTSVSVGPGIAIFGTLAVGMVLAALWMLVLRVLRAEGEQQNQFRLVLAGTALMFIGIISCNFVLPNFFNNSSLVPMGAIFIFPFVAFTFYAIAKHGLLDVKVVSTEILTFVLTIITFAEVAVTTDPALIIFRSIIFLLVLFFGISLIRSVLREVEQRQELQDLSSRLGNVNEQLENLSKFKTQLISLVSHQLKSPLAAIKGHAQLIEQGLYGPVEPKVKEATGKIENAAENLVQLVNTLLDLRKVEEGKMEYVFEPIDLSTMVREMVEELSTLASQKGISLEYVPPPAPVMVKADKQKLRQVIQNLIDNAIKYTPKGYVRAMLRAEDGKAYFSVRDTGLGISPVLLPHLFEEFMRDEKVKRQIRGTGLGLFIAKRIVEAHGGTLDASSEGDDKGSTFTMTLALSR
jgi:signal transduction histidine kinase